LGWRPCGFLPPIDTLGRRGGFLSDPSNPAAEWAFHKQQDASGKCRWWGNRMRGVRAASFCLAVTLLVAAVLAPSVARSTIMQRTSDLTERFKISFPVEWQVVKAKSGMPAVSGVGPALRGQFHPMPVTSYARAAKPLMALAFHEFTVLQEGPARIAHRDGYYRYYTWRPKTGGVLYQVQAYFTIGRLGYVLTGTTLNNPTRIRRDVPVISQIFETFTPNPR
jgi:hypothetical protein